MTKAHLQFTRQSHSRICRSKVVVKWTWQVAQFPGQLQVHERAVGMRVRLHYPNACSATPVKLHELSNLSQERTNEGRVIFLLAFLQAPLLAPFAFVWRIKEPVARQSITINIVQMLQQVLLQHNWDVRIRSRELTLCKSTAGVRYALPWVKIDLGFSPICANTWQSVSAEG